MAQEALNAIRLIQEVNAKGARLDLEGPHLIVESDQGPIPDLLLEELRRQKAEVVSVLRAGNLDTISLRSQDSSDIIPGRERQPLDFVGKRVTFLLKGSFEHCLPVDNPEFAQGIVIQQRWLGFTRRGKIPEYEVTIATDDGRTLDRRLVEDYVTVEDPDLI